MTAPVIRSALDETTWSLHAFLKLLQSTRRERTAPFDVSSVALATGLSEQLLRPKDVRRFPEIVALAFWLRPGAVAALERAFTEAVDREEVLLVPRGLSFHVPPANVDGLFVQAWVLSMLVGNRNVVRLSERRTESAERILAAIHTVFDDPAFARLRSLNHFVHTGHDDDVSRALSAVADVRAVWGGDETVRHFRRFPLPVRAREIAFPNRHSLALIDAEAVGAASDEHLATLAGHFFNDAYWFDQAACASPRLILWRATDPASAAAARARFHVAVGDAVAAHGYDVEAGTAIAKLAFGYGAAITQPVRSVESDGARATWVLLDGLEGYDRRTCGGGLFFEYVAGDPATDLARLLTSEDQTIAYWGIPFEEVRALAGGLRGAGGDRWVPIGRALEFDHLWDGVDLMQEFAKRVVVRRAI